MPLSPQEYGDFPFRTPGMNLPPRYNHPQGQPLPRPINPIPPTFPFRSQKVDASRGMPGMNDIDQRDPNVDRLYPEVLQALGGKIKSDSYQPGMPSLWQQYLPINRGDSQKYWSKIRDLAPEGMDPDMWDPGMVYDPTGDWLGAPKSSIALEGYMEPQERRRPLPHEPVFNRLESLHKRLVDSLRGIAGRNKKEQTRYPGDRHPSKAFSQRQLMDYYRMFLRPFPMEQAPITENLVPWDSVGPSNRDWQPRGEPVPMIRSPWESEYWKNYGKGKKRGEK